MSLRLDHIALPAFDGTATLRFYTDILGLPLVDALPGDDWEGRPWLMMIFGLAGGGTIVLSSLHGAQRPNRDDLPREVRHYAIAATSLDELQGWKDRLRAHSIGFSEENHGIQRSIYFEDPNGHVLEITAPESKRTDAVNAPAAAVVKAWLDAHQKSDRHRLASVLQALDAAMEAPYRKLANHLRRSCRATPS